MATGLNVKTVIAVGLLCLGLLVLVPHSLAQSEELHVQLTGVENEAHPEVTTWAAVFDQHGEPILGLTERDLDVTEDGVPVPTSSLQVESDATRPLRLALVIDAGATDAAWPVIQRAANQVIDQLGAGDEAAVFAFSDIVHLQQDFTGHHGKLKAAVDQRPASTEEGGEPLLFEATRDAVEMVDRATPGRTAVLLFVGSDAEPDRAPDGPIGTAQTLGVPIYTFALDSSVKPDTLQLMSHLTGGQSYVTPSDEQLTDDLQLLDVLLRQGYRITFTSHLVGDGEQRNFALAVTYNGMEAGAEGTYPAPARGLAVQLEPVAEADLGGTVTLKAGTTAPVEVDAVEYYLDDQLLARETTPPFTFEWDSSTVEPGRYTLSATLFDTVGNQGSAQQAIELAPPLSVSVSKPEPVRAGEQVAIEATVGGAAGEAVVTFLVNGEQVQRIDQPPYQYRLDSGRYQAGTHFLTVRVEDAQGRTGEATQAVQVLAPADSSWTGTAGIVAIILLVIVTAVLFFFLRRWQKQSRLQHFLIELHNQGNTSNQYLLRATDPSGMLQFTFTWKGRELSPAEPPRARAEPQPSPVATQTATTTLPAAAQGAAPSAAAPAGSSQQGGTPASSSGSTPAAKQAGEKFSVDDAMDKGNESYSLFATVGQLLPRSIGGALLGFAGRMRYAQMLFQRIRLVPAMAKKLFNRKPKQGSGTSQARPAQPAQPAQTATQPQAPVAEFAWVRTAAIEAGDSLMIELTIDPARCRTGYDYPFRVLSRVSAQTSVPLVIEEGTIVLEGPTFFQRLLVPALLLCVTLLVALTIAFMVTGTGLFA